MYKLFCRSLTLGIFAFLTLYIVIPQPSWGQTTQGQLAHPSYVAVDSAGNVYVTEREKHLIQKFDRSGAFIAQWGTFGSTDGQFNFPRGIAIDSLDNVYVADSGNSRIQKFSSKGTFITKWGTFGVLDRQFHRPVAIALGPNNNVYVADTALKRIQVFDSAGTFLRRWGGWIGTGDGQFSSFQGPSGIAVDGSGNVYVSDTGNHRILEFTNTGQFIGWAGRCTSGTNCDTLTQKSSGFRCTASTCSISSFGSSNGQFTLPLELVRDSLGNIYVADSTNNRIQKFDSTGRFSTAWGSRGSGDGQFSRPIDVAVDSLNNIYVADTENNRIQKFTNTGTLIAVWGADIRMSASPGEAPGSVDPIILLPSGTKSSTIRIESINNFAGQITLIASCCLDFNTSLGTVITGITTQLSPNQVIVPSNGSVTSRLTITTSGAPAGKFIVPVTGANPALGITRQIGVVFTVLPADGSLPSCPRFQGPEPVVGGTFGFPPPNLPVLLSTNELFEKIATLKASEPTRTTITIAVLNPPNTDAWRMVIEESVQPSLQSDEALVVLVNDMGWEKAVSAFNSNICDSPSQIRVASGMSGQMMIRKSDTTTLVFSKPVCIAELLFICWATEWKDIAVWSEPNFWRIFGGKKITFTWRRD